MRVLVTGGAGNVAGWLARTAPDGVELHLTEHITPVPAAVRGAATVHVLDLLDVPLVDGLLDSVRPHVVVHAAYAPDRRDAVVDATANLARAAASIGSSLMHLSTDVVFAGDAPPYTEDASPDPITDYGSWKAEAEEVVRSVVSDACITRTSLVPSLGPLGPLDRATAALVAGLSGGRPVTLFADEMRQPIRAADLALEMWAMVALDRDERSGVWHLPGPEHLSRHGIGLRIAGALGLDPAGIIAGRSTDQVSRRPLDPRMLGTRRNRLGVAPLPFDRPVSAP